MKIGFRRFKNGKLSDDFEPVEINIKKKDYKFIFIKYSYSDNNSYSGYRYWVLDVEYRNIFQYPNKRPDKGHRDVSDYTRLNDSELNLIELNVIPLSDGTGNGRRWVYSDMLKTFSQEDFGI